MILPLFSVCTSYCFYIVWATGVCKQISFVRNYFWYSSLTKWTWNKKRIYAFNKISSPWQLSPILPPSITQPKPWIQTSPQIPPLAVNHYTTTSVNCLEKLDPSQLFRNSSYRVVPMLGPPKLFSVLENTLQTLSHYSDLKMKFHQLSLNTILVKNQPMTKKSSE